MKTLKTTLLALALGTFAISASAADEVATEGAEVGKWTMDFPAAKKLASEKELPMMLNFTGSDWCGWCKLMDSQVFAKDDWKKYAAEKVVLVTLDFPQDKSIVPDKYVTQNERLKEKFGIQGFPTYVVLDADGETQIGQLGAGQEKTPETFIAEFEATVKTSAANIEAYTKANPEKAEAFKAAIAEEKAAKKALADWIATEPERNDENQKKFAAFNERIEAATAKLAEF